MGFNLALGLFMLFAGVYLLVAAIRGKGSVYQNDNIKKGHEEKYKKTVRICCYVISPILIASFVFALLAYALGYGIIGQELSSDKLHELYSMCTLISDITRWTGLVAIVAMIILTMRMSDKSVAEVPVHEGGKNPAFDFDEDEPQTNKESVVPNPGDDSEKD